MDYFGSDLYIDELSQSKSIAGVRATFYNAADEVVQNEHGDLMQYTLNASDVGHMLALPQRESTFSYVSFDLKLRSDAAFDLRNLYFHCPRPSLRSESDEEQRTLSFAYSSRWRNRNHLWSVIVLGGFDNEGLQSPSHVSQSFKMQVVIWRWNYFRWPRHLRCIEVQ